MSGTLVLIGLSGYVGLLLRIVRDLRRVHSHLASFAYSVLRRPQRVAAARTNKDDDAVDRG